MSASEYLSEPETRFPAVSWVQVPEAKSPQYIAGVPQSPGCVSVSPEILSPEFHARVKRVPKSPEFGEYVPREEYVPTSPTYVPGEYLPDSPKEREESGPLNRCQTLVACKASPKPMSEAVKKQWESARIVGCLMNAVLDGNYKDVVRNACLMRARDDKLSVEDKEFLRENLLNHMIEEAKKAKESRERRAKKQRLEPGEGQDPKFEKGEQALRTMKTMYDDWLFGLKTALQQVLEAQMDLVKRLDKEFAREISNITWLNDVNAVIIANCRNLLAQMQKEMVDIFGFVSRGEEAIRQSSEPLIAALHKVETIYRNVYGPLFDSSDVMKVHVLEVLFKRCAVYPRMHFEVKKYVAHSFPSYAERAAAEEDVPTAPADSLGISVAALAATSADLLLSNANEASAAWELMDLAMLCGNGFKEAVTTGMICSPELESDVGASTEALLAFAMIQTEPAADA